MPAEGNVIGSDDEDALPGVEEDEGEEEAVPMDEADDAEQVAEENVDSGLRIFSRGKRFKVWQTNVVRTHERPVPVKSGETLAAMRYSGTKSAWPKIEPADIVVLKGDILNSENKLVQAYVWYVRAVVEGSPPNLTAMDSSILIHVPKAVAMALMQAMSKEQRLQNSSLLKVYTPFNENFKPLQPVGNNNWELDSSPFESAEVREPKKRKANDPAAAAPPAAAVEAPAAASPSPASGGAGTSSASNKEGKKARIDMTPQAPKKTAAANPKKILKPADSATAPPSKAAAAAPAAPAAAAAAKVNPVFAASKHPAAKSPTAAAPSPGPATPVQEPALPLVVPDDIAIDPVITATGASTPANAREAKRGTVVRHVFEPFSKGQVELTATWTGTQVPGAEPEHEQCFVIPSTARKWRITVELQQGAE